MADESNMKMLKESKKKTKKRKLEKSSEDGEEENSEAKATDSRPAEEADEVLKNLQDISRCFGVGGLFGKKKRKIESSGGKVSLLEDWVTQETVRSLSLGQRYTKEVSHEVLALLQQLKKLLVFAKRLHGKKGSKTQNKDLVLDVLLKDIKVDPSLSIPERYRQMGLWSQVLQVNQRLPTMLEEVGVTDSTQQFDSSSETRLSGSSQKDGADTPTCEVTGTQVQSFRDFYMDVVTSTFANDLDTLRKDDSFNSKHVSALIDCLETGQDIWSDLEKSLLQNSVTK